MRLMGYLLVIFIIGIVVLVLIQLASYIYALSWEISSLLEREYGTMGEFSRHIDGINHAVGGIELGLIIAFIGMIIAIFAYSRRR